MFFEELKHDSLIILHYFSTVLLTPHKLRLNFKLRDADDNYILTINDVTVADDEKPGSLS